MGLSEASKTTTARILVTDRARIQALQDQYEQSSGHGQRPTEAQVLHWGIRELEDRLERERAEVP